MHTRTHNDVIYRWALAAKSACRFCTQGVTATTLWPFRPQLCRCAHVICACNMSIYVTQICACNMSIYVTQICACNMSIYATHVKSYTYNVICACMSSHTSYDLWHISPHHKSNNGNINVWLIWVNAFWLFLSVCWSYIYKYVYTHMTKCHKCNIWQDQSFVLFCRRD